MNIVIVGLGKFGSELVETLSTEKHNANCKIKSMETYDKFKSIIINDFKIQA